MAPEDWELRTPEVAEDVVDDVMAARLGRRRGGSDALPEGGAIGPEARLRSGGATGVERPGGAVARALDQDARAVEARRAEGGGARR